MLKIIISLTLAFALSACSTKETTEDRILTGKVKEQEPADTPQQIAMRAAEAFTGSPELTAEQKMKLHAIYTRVYAESMQIRRDIGQSKSLLFMTVAKSGYKSSEVSKLKKKIVDLDQKRLKIMFQALDDVQKIVGKGVEKEQIYKHFYEHEYPLKYEFQP